MGSCFLGASCTQTPNSSLTPKPFGCRWSDISIDYDDIGISYSIDGASWKSAVAQYRQTSFGSTTQAFALALNASSHPHPLSFIRYAVWATVGNGAKVWDNNEGDDYFAAFPAPTPEAIIEHVRSPSRVSLRPKLSDRVTPEEQPRADALAMLQQFQLGRCKVFSEIRFQSGCSAMASNATSQCVNSPKPSPLLIVNGIQM